VCASSCACGSVEESKCQKTDNLKDKNLSKERKRKKGVKKGVRSLFDTWLEIFLMCVKGDGA